MMVKARSWLPSLEHSMTMVKVAEKEKVEPIGGVLESEGLRIRGMESVWNGDQVPIHSTRSFQI